MNNQLDPARDWQRPGTPDQWDRVRRAAGSGGRDAARAAAAERGARLCGTDPSWYGF